MQAKSNNRLIKNIGICVAIIALGVGAGFTINYAPHSSMFSL